MELKPGLCNNLEGGTGWMVGGRVRRERTQEYLWLIHVDIWQKQTQHRKAIILQLKIIFSRKKKKKIISSRIYNCFLDLTQVGRKHLWETAFI